MNQESTGFTPQDYKELEALLAKAGCGLSNNEAPASRWQDSLEYDSKGRIKQTNVNCRLVLENDELLKDAIKLNELTGGIDVVKDLGWQRDVITLTDTDVDNIIIYLEENYGLKVDKLIERGIRIVANENRYHPIKDKLNSLQWDGTKRLNKALHHFLGVDQTPLVTESLKLFMLGAAERIFNPGCKFEYMLCLVGGQGAGKSTFMRFMALNDDWFSDDIKQLSDKDVFEHLQGHWIIEMPEMLAILQAKMVEETKAFLSRMKDNYRIKYEKRPADHKRQCVFSGTSNRLQFLPPDKSGNRRFLPIEVNTEKAEVHILEDESYSRAYFEQLWAEIMVIYKAKNYSLALSKEMQEDLVMEQARFTPEDPMETAIVNFIEEKEPEYVCVKLLYEKALNHYRTDSPAAWESNSIGEIMDQRFKDTYKRVSSHSFSDYGTQRAWARIRLSNFRPLSEKEEEELPFK